MTAEEILLVLGMFAVTFGVRYVPLALMGGVQLPPAAIRALKYVPAAVLTAIIIPEVLIPNREVRLALDSPYLLAAVVATLAAWRTKNMLLTIVLGMATFLLLRAITGG
jgi:branched-subunit amino acid transport protein